MFSTAIIYRSEMDYISRCILDSPDIETGGQLFGLWTNGGVPVIMYAIGPGPGANHQQCWFQQDLRYLSGIGNYLREAYGLVHLGEWHSHHRLGLARPSSHDADTMRSSIRSSGLDRFLLCIGNVREGGSSLGAFGFEAAHYDYTNLSWDIKEMESPFRPIIDRIMAPVLCHPRTFFARYARAETALNQPVITITHPTALPSSNTPDYDHTSASSTRTTGSRAAGHSRRSHLRRRHRRTKAKAQARRSHK